MENAYSEKELAHTWAIMLGRWHRHLRIGIGIFYIGGSVFILHTTKLSVYILIPRENSTGTCWYLYTRIIRGMTNSLKIKSKYGSIKAFENENF